MSVKHIKQSPTQTIRYTWTSQKKDLRKWSFIPKISAKELIEKDLEDVVVERMLIELLCRTQNIKQVQIINGLQKGNITKALNGEHVGTIIYQD